MSRAIQNLQVAAAVTVQTTLATGVIFASANLIKMRHFTVVVQNITAGANFNACQLEASPDGTTWYTVDTTTLATLATGSMGEIKVTDNPRQYYRLRATVAAGSTTVNAWIIGGD